MSASRRIDQLEMGRPAEAADSMVVNGEIAAQRADRYVSELRRILARFGTQRTLHRGASLFNPGDLSRHLYIIESGRIDIFLPEDPERHPVASFHPGASFLFDFGGYQVAALEAAEDSFVIDVPFGRLTRLCEQEMDLRMLLRQCHAFDLKSFLDACFPARSRFRLAHQAAESLRRPEDGFLLPLDAKSATQTGRGKRHASNARRSRLAQTRDGRNRTGES